MTLYEFNMLTLEEKQSTVWKKGVFLDNYITKDIKINCYALDKFFVEVVYDAQHNANATDSLVVVVYAPEANLYQVFDPSGTREEAAVNLPLPAFMAGLVVQVWVTFADTTNKEAAISTYLGAVTVT